MSFSQRQLSLLLALCWLVMQVQVLASSAFGCGHEAGVSAGTHPACASVHTAIMAGGDLENDPGSYPASEQECHARLLDCQACVLHCAMAAPVLLASAPPLPSSDARATREATTPRACDDRAPDSRYRPPIC